MQFPALITLLCERFGATVARTEKIGEAIDMDFIIKNCQPRGHAAPPQPAPQHPRSIPQIWDNLTGEFQRMRLQNNLILDRQEALRIRGSI